MHKLNTRKRHVLVERPDTLIAAAYEFPLRHQLLAGPVLTVLTGGALAGAALSARWWWVLTLSVALLVIGGVSVFRRWAVVRRTTWYELRGASALIGGERLPYSDLREVRLVSELLGKGGRYPFQRSWTLTLYWPGEKCLQVAHGSIRRHERVIDEVIRCLPPKFVRELDPKRVRRAFR